MRGNQFHNISILLNAVCVRCQTFWQFCIVGAIIECRVASLSYFYCVRDFSVEVDVGVIGFGNFEHLSICSESYFITIIVKTNTIFIWIGFT